jgi:hypothetical protein
MMNHRYDGPHSRHIGGKPCIDGYGDLVGPDDAIPPEELPHGVSGMMCHKCDQNLKGVALKLASSASYAVVSYGA